MKKQERAVILIMFFVCTVIASLPLFRNTIFGVDVQDTFFHTQRICSIKNALLEGQFPVRIYAEIYNDYGYGASLFYPDIFLYIPAVFCMLGLPLAASYNLFLILINVATITIVYVGFSKITQSKMIGALAAILYQMSIYRLLDLYTRASIGEALAFIFCPMVLWGFTAICRKEYRAWYVLAIAYTGLLQSHILTFIMMVLVGVMYVLFHGKAFLDKKAIVAVVKAVIVTILINAWFLLPLLQVSGMNVIAFLGTESYWQTGASFAQLWDVRYVTAGGHELYNFAATPSMPKTPGVFLFVGAILLVPAFIFYRTRIGNEKKSVLCYLGAGLLATVMVTYIFPWNWIRKIGFLKIFFEKFQFIWRWNILAILFLSVAAAYGFYYLFLKGQKYTKIYFILIAVAACLFSGVYLRQYVKQATEYTSEQAIEKGYMDRLYVVPGFNTEALGNFASNIEGIQITDVIKGYLEITVDFKYETKQNTEEPPYIEVPITYYPGYNAYIDGEKVQTECSIWGVVRVLMPQEVMEGTLYVVYEESTINQIANIISILTMLGVLAWTIWKGARKR